MSDLAPFVAATLKDKTVAELFEENRKLREEKRALEYAEITGPNRQPVYARGHLRDNGHEDDSNYWYINMVVEERLPCPLEGIKDIEIWVRNVKAKAVNTLEAGITIAPPCYSHDIARVALWLGRDVLIGCYFSLSQEERRNIEASAAEAHAQSRETLSLRGHHTFRVVTKVLDPSKTCTFVGIYLRQNVVEL